MPERFGGYRERTAEKAECKVQEESGAKVSGGLERMARRILGLRQLELAERRGRWKKGEPAGDRIVATELGLEDYDTSGGVATLKELVKYLEINPAATSGLAKYDEEKEPYPYLDPWEKKVKVAPLQEIVAKLGTRPTAFAIKVASDEDYRRLLYNAHRF